MLALGLGGSNHDYAARLRADGLSRLRVYQAGDSAHSVSPDRGARAPAGAARLPPWPARCSGAGGHRTVRGGKIVTIEILADPHRLRDLDLS
jgi:hypothetical protein